jgi:hypothetical protein
MLDFLGHTYIYRGGIKIRVSLVFLLRYVF